MTLLYCDLETFSPVPIKSGSHRYAEQAEVLLWAYALDDGPVQVWDLTAQLATPTDLLVALHSSSVTTVWHNGAMFDAVVLRHARPGLEPAIERMHDTMVMAMSHSLPGSLDKLGEVLGLPTDMQKHKDGKALIRLFCVPRPKNMKLRRATRETHPEEWARFVEYARQDVAAMREIYKKLPKWNVTGREYALWQLDQKINLRGVAIDLELAHAAIRASDRAQVILAARTVDATNGEVQKATQRDVMLDHIMAEYQIHMDDLQGATLERMLDDPDLPEGLRELLTIRLQASKTSTAKYKRLIDVTSTDGRLRGLLQFNGASRTGRWSGRNFQPQNLPRPALDHDQIDFGIEAMKVDAEDMLFDNVMELTSSAIRGCIIAPPGKKLVISDLSNIEGRMLAWLAGEEWKLQAFRDYDTGTGHDLYKLAYAKSFGVSPADVDKDQRQVGKVQELALGYEGGVGAFLTFSMAYSIDLEQMAKKAWDSLPDDLVREADDFHEWTVKQKRSTFGLSREAFITCDVFKRGWRSGHPRVATLWKELEYACIAAVESPGRTIPCRKFKVRRDGAWLRIGLPSGRALCYPQPRVDEGKLSYMGTNQYTRKWERIKTYGGKLVENCTQGAARDVMAHNMPLIDASGYQIVLSVHDELITETPATNEFNEAGLSAMLSAVPEWAEGLPLAAAGFETTRYRKD